MIENFQYTSFKSHWKSRPRRFQSAAACARICGDQQINNSWNQFLFCFAGEQLVASALRQSCLLPINLYTTSRQPASLKVMEAICYLNNINVQKRAEDMPAAPKSPRPISFYQGQLKSNLNKLHATECQP
jgi:hypothetical protein